MGNNSLQFTGDGQWQGKGTLPLTIRESRTASTLFQALVTEIKEAGEIFVSLKKNDNKLIGQERFLLSNEIEDVLGGLFFLYKTIMQAGKNPFYSQYTGSAENFISEFTGYSWKAQGSMKARPVSGSFEEWFNTFLLQEMGAFIKSYGKVFEDGILDFEEKEKLLKELNRLIFGILKAEKGLKTGLLN